ncbi:O-antigen ligase family protein [Spirulina subsalsa FACHB-351]|uniref:O-antigen ligase family protein n=1 Tax=Spirulina subsalsa FACHB-351 TaxID=234711 RepID=A0ABT3L8A9_9CYAN|nr:O-antigen ligase family protein [Spirulina subsalsa]MCW6037724.1 O-antigen ligase family protein [Spirulina subsalsa FACHB-351]
MASLPLQPWVWRCFLLGLFLFPLWPAVGAVGLGLPLLVTWGKHGRTLVKKPLNQALGGLIVLWLLTTVQAEFPLESLLGLGNFIPQFLFFGAIAFFVRTPAQLTPMAWAFTLPALAVVLLGLAQMGLDWATPPGWENLTGWHIIPGGYPVGRMASLFMYANILACYLLLIFNLTLGLWVQQWERWRQNRTAPQTYALIGLSLILVGIAIALILTKSRSAWIFALLSLAAFALYYSWRFLLLTLTSLSTVILWASFLPQWGGETLRQIVPFYFWGRLSGAMYPNVADAHTRLNQWEFCLNLVRERPLLGWGLRNFDPLYHSATQHWLGHPHNLWMMLLAETGIPATLLFCAIVGWILAQTLRQLLHHPSPTLLFAYFMAFISCMGFNGFDVSIFDFRVNVMGWIILGALGGIVHSQRQPPTKNPENPVKLHKNHENRDSQRN